MEEKKVKLVAAVCTQCGAQLEVDPNAEAAVCKYCNTPKSALDFVGDQMKESRQHKKEMFRMKAENEKQFFVTFFKFFGIFAIVVIILWAILCNFM